MENAESQKNYGIIDCDVHQSISGFDELKPYIPRGLWHRLDGAGGYGVGSGGVFPGPNYPSPVGILREDSKPKNGIPGSDVQFTIKQLIEPYGIEYAILTGALLSLNSIANADFAAALASATNDWTADKWLSQDKRFKGSIIVAPQDPQLAAKEIDRLAGNKDFIQVLCGGASKMPFGDRYYEPILEACERNGLPFAIHPGCEGDGVTHSVTALGHVQHYIERHSALPQTAMTHLITMVFQGAFEKFPQLQFVIMEYGIAWMPHVMWRMDKLYKGLRPEVPWLTKLPSKYIKDHVKMSTQPIEEPESNVHLEQMIDMLGCDNMLMFASDYPHWDFDSPNLALNNIRNKTLKRQILRENALSLYSLSSEVKI